MDGRRCSARTDREWVLYYYIVDLQNSCYNSDPKQFEELIMNLSSQCEFDCSEL